MGKIDKDKNDSNDLKIRMYLETFSQYLLSNK